MFFSFLLRRGLWVCGPAVVVLSFMLGSCGNTRQFTYMQGTFDTARLSEIKIVEPIIQKGDLLSIIVYSDNPPATAIYNQAQTGSVGGGAGGGTTTGGGGTGGVGGGGGGGGGTTGGTSAATTSSTGTSGGSPGTGGYQVDEKGNIEFQGLGLIHVDGMARSELKELLETKLKTYLTNPYCTIRFQNYKFTMLGELGHPGIFSFPGEHVNLLEAVGMAGDLTFYGRRDNVLVIREKDGKRQWARLDITKPEIMGSPFFYLQPNDVIIVEQTNKKIAANDVVVTRNISILVSLVSVAAILYGIFRK